MKNRKKMEKWFGDEDFAQYVKQRTAREMQTRLDTGYHDRDFDRMDEAFENEDGYLVPMCEYLSYKFHVACLRKNRRQREQGMWEVYFNLQMLGVYSTFHVFDDLNAELWEELMPVIHRDYVHTLNRQKK